MVALKLCFSSFAFLVVALAPGFLEPLRYPPAGVAVCPGSQCLVGHKVRRVAFPSGWKGTTSTQEIALSAWAWSSLHMRRRLDLAVSRRLT